LLTHVGDEIVAVDGVRVRSTSHLNKLIAGRAGESINLDISHEGILTSTEVTIGESLQHGVTLKGKGNDRWRAWITTRQDP